MTQGHLALLFTSDVAVTWSMSNPAPGAQSALRRLLESEQHARQRVSDAEAAREIAAADARLEAEIAAADDVAATNLAAAVARVVRWVTAAEP